MLKKISIVLLALLVTLPYFPPSADAQNTNVHVVQRGESMWKIAVKYQIGLKEIIAANPKVYNPALIYPNQKLNIPNIDSIKSVEQQVLTIVNQERSKAGLKPLQMDWELQRVARIKSQDMANNAYFSHTSPTYGSPFDMMKRFGINYRSAGENIASGQNSPQEVMKAWMNSSGHRANILKAEFTHIGVGYHKGGQYGHMWTQMFITK